MRNQNKRERVLFSPNEKKIIINSLKGFNVHTMRRKERI